MKCHACGSPPLTQRSRDALAAIKRNPGMTSVGLARRLGIGKAAMVPHVRRLEDAGLIERRQSEADPRAWQLYPTAQARQG